MDGARGRRHSERTCGGFVASFHSRPFEVYLLYPLPKFPSVLYINSLHRPSSMEKPSRGGEKRTAVWAAHPEERGSEDVVAPPVCDHRGVPPR